jgi:tRNA nucleotidyltransferase (CCA-adding enzyme)
MSAGHDSHDWRFWLAWSQSEEPARVLWNLHDSGELVEWPELHALVGVPQDPEWHPEGDVWVHTLLVCDAAAAIATRDSLASPERVALLLAALCHDLGKPATTQFETGRWRASGHPEAGIEPTERLLARMQAPPELLEPLRPLVREHLVHAQTGMSARGIRRILRRLQPATLPQLARLIEADLSGRPPLPRGLTPAVADWLARAEEQLSLGLTEGATVDSEAPLLQGRHLIALGYEPAVWFGKVLRECHAAQLAGEFVDEAGGGEFLQARLAELRPTGREEDGGTLPRRD